MKKHLFIEKRPSKPGDYLTDLGWLTFDGENWHYRNLSRHVVRESALEYWLE